MSVDARTCKHLKQLLGDEFEAARVSAAASDVTHTTVPGDVNGRKRKAEGHVSVASSKKQPQNGNPSTKNISPADEEMIAEGNSTADPLASIQGIQRNPF